jgi:hypothetical protein
LVIIAKYLKYPSHNTFIKENIMKLTTIALTLGLFFAANAMATPVDLITNGNFEVQTAGGSVFLNDTTAVTGWTAAGLAYLFVPGAGASGTTADTSGGFVDFWGTGRSNTILYGPGNGAFNGLTNSSAGGNFIGLDGDYGQHSTMSQMINGLTVGTNYVVSFNWAGAQQTGFSGDTTDSLQVTLGNEVHTSQIISNVSTGFTGWTTSTLFFTATSTSELLTFLSVGTPVGLPPFALLDGVTMTVPEPESWTMLAPGLIGLLAFRRRKTSAGSKAVA